MQLTQAGIEKIVTDAFGPSNQCELTYQIIKGIVVDVLPHLPNPLTKVDLTVVAGPPPVVISPVRTADLFEIESVAAFCILPSSTREENVTLPACAKEAPAYDDDAETGLGAVPNAALDPRPSSPKVTGSTPPPAEKPAPTKPSPLIRLSSAPVVVETDDDETAADGGEDANEKREPPPQSTTSNRSQPASSSSPSYEGKQFSERKRRRATADTPREGDRDVAVIPLPPPEPSTWLPPIAFRCPSCKQGLAMAVYPWSPATADQEAEEKGAE